MYKTLIISIIFNLFISSANAEVYKQLQEKWDYIKFGIDDVKEQKKEIKKLYSLSNKILQENPNNPEVLTWVGIITVTRAEAFRDIYSIFDIRKAKKIFEKAISINPNSLHSAAEVSLAALYYKTPIWPIGIKDTEKAEGMLMHSLKVFPDNIEANYFYADYLIYSGKINESKPYYIYALEAPIRLDRVYADKYRKTKLKSDYKLIYNIK